MNILIINSSDQGGGAELVNTNMNKYFIDYGFNSKMLVGKKKGNEENTFSIDNEYHSSVWVRLNKYLANSLPYPFTNFFKIIGLPNWRYKQLGREPLYFPGSNSFFSSLEKYPDLIQIGNLHGKYFDIRLLAKISSKTPIVLRLSDMWMLTGHCAHSLSCNRWEIGCGKCPDLNLYPSIKRDGTKKNLQVKEAIYRRSRLYISTPSKWLMEKVKRSVLKYSAIDYRVIPTGIDLSFFKPGKKNELRKSMNIPLKDKVILTIKSGFTGYKWDIPNEFFTLLDESLSTKYKITLLMIGSNQSSQNFNNITVVNIPHVDNREKMKKYYRIADLYIHPSKVENYSNVIMEAQACGLPVLAYEVGGIPEQIIPLNKSTSFYSKKNKPTGVLVGQLNYDELLELLVFLLKNDEIRQELSANAIQLAKEKFSFDIFANGYMNWYKEIISSNRHN